MKVLEGTWIPNWKVHVIYIIKNAINFFCIHLILMFRMNVRFIWFHITLFTSITRLCMTHKIPHNILGYFPKSDYILFSWISCATFFRCPCRPQYIFAHTNFTMGQSPIKVLNTMPLSIHLSSYVDASTEYSSRIYVIEEWLGQVGQVGNYRK